MIKTVIQDIPSTQLINDTLNHSNKQWFAIYTIVRHEKIVNLALTDKNIETYLPLREETSQWKDRVKKIKHPLFPGYLFINIYLNDRLNVHNTRGVVRILGVNGSPSPVPVEQIESIRRLLERNEKYDPFPYIAHGKEVVVIHGLLQGIRGRILERRGDYRLIISVDIIKRSVSVEVDIRDVELI